MVVRTVLDNPQVHERGGGNQRRQLTELKARCSPRKLRAIRARAAGLEA